MDLKMKRLSPELVQDFLDYFDNVAFSDHPEWAGCYCLESHISHEEDGETDGKDIVWRRQKAKELVETGVMQGYLAYDKDEVVGWCNADEKQNLYPIKQDSNYWLAGDENAKIKSVYCFDIAPARRGEGIAAWMLQKVCEEAFAEGYDIVEGYPQKEWAYHGPLPLYENAGFKQVHEFGAICIYRKER